MTQPSPRARKPSAKTTRSARPRLPKAVQLAVDAAVGKKGHEVVVLDLQRLQALADLGFFLFAGGDIDHGLDIIPERSSYPYLVRL